MFKRKDKIIGGFLAFMVIGILILVGPADAVTVTLSQPNDVTKGSDVSFSVTVEIKDPDLVPIQYTTLTITGPSGFSTKTCQIANDGTDDCADVDITISKSNVNYNTGVQYGYDQNLGYGYSLGNEYGYQSATLGTITYNVVWHTTSVLIDGSYSVKADVIAQGSSSDHTYSSSSQSFSVSTASSGSSGGGGGGSQDNKHNYITSPVQPITPSTPTSPTTPSTPTTEGETGPTGMAGITGGAITNFFNSTPVKGTGVALIVIAVGLGAFYMLKKRRIGL